MTDPSDTQNLVIRASTGDSQAVTELMEMYRGRLKRMVSLRLDRRLRKRVDPSDVVQEALIVASNRLREYADQPTMEFYLWLRWITADKLLNAHREHLGTQKRDVSQEVSIYRRPMPEACSVSLAQQLLGHLTSPTQAVQRAETQLLVQDVLNSMDPIDREILVLRNFEQLSTTETAEALGIKRSTASKRYIAALKRLKQALSSTSEFRDLKNTYRE
jgi:RNA polymerase sigma-70 factor (ECF subfamily)